jgi:hypothetical protein
MGQGFCRPRVLPGPSLAYRQSDAIPAIRQRALKAGTPESGIKHGQGQAAATGLQAGPAADKPRQTVVELQGKGRQDRARIEVLLPSVSSRLSTVVCRAYPRRPTWPTHRATGNHPEAISRRDLPVLRNRPLLLRAFIGRADRRRHSASNSRSTAFQGVSEAAAVRQRHKHLVYAAGRRSPTS